jgi:hypothetical protein
MNRRDLSITEGRLKFICIVLVILFSSCSAELENGIRSYEECVKAGNVILRSMPPQCVTREGKRFIADVDIRNNLTQRRTPEVSNPLVKEDKRPERNKDYCQDLCGDGVCQAVVCLAIGCPCPEDVRSCPSDCREQRE